jgi:hypothetical protein
VLEGVKVYPAQASVNIEIKPVEPEVSEEGDIE